MTTQCSNSTSLLLPQPVAYQLFTTNEAYVAPAWWNCQLKEVTPLDVLVQPFGIAPPQNISRDSSLFFSDVIFIHFCLSVINSCDAVALKRLCINLLLRRYHIYNPSTTASDDATTTVWHNKKMINWSLDAIVYESTVGEVLISLISNADEFKSGNTTKSVFALVTSLFKWMLWSHAAGWQRLNFFAVYIKINGNEVYCDLILSNKKITARFQLQLQSYVYPHIQLDLPVYEASMCSMMDKRLCRRLTALWRYINFVLLLLLLSYWHIFTINQLTEQRHIVQ